MSKYGECMCKVCEQKRVAVAEVDKLKGMMVKTMSADHEKQYVGSAKTQPDFEQLKKFEKMADAALIADLQAKILKQDKQFAELAKEKDQMSKAMLDISNQAMKDVVNAAGATIADLNRQLALQENESEFWRLRAEKNAGGKPVDISFATSISIMDADKFTKGEMEQIIKQIEKDGAFYNGGCV